MLVPSRVISYRTANDTSPAMIRALKGDYAFGFRGPRFFPFGQPPFLPASEAISSRLALESD